MLAAWRDGDRGAGAVEAAAAGASDWKVTGGPGHDMVITQYYYVERIEVNGRSEKGAAVLAISPIPTCLSLITYFMNVPYPQTIIIKF